MIPASNTHASLLPHTLNMLAATEKKPRHAKRQNNNGTTAEGYCHGELLLMLRIVRQVPAPLKI